MLALLSSAATGRAGILLSVLNSLFLFAQTLLHMLKNDRLATLQPTLHPSEFGVFTADLSEALHFGACNTLPIDLRAVWHAVETS